MGFNHVHLSQYLNKTRFITLSTVKNGNPALRTMAAFAAEGISPVFSTHRDTDKVRQIEENPHVSILFQHENQHLRTFVNITISGIARRVDDRDDQERIIALIGARNLRYQERAARGELIEHLFYRVEPVEIKILDFARSPSPQGVQLVRLSGGKEKAARAA
ncbi:MAG: pyridoxamine 5'-phosphate oxidase family protein [Geobacter sp.]|nr:pyridoxamine 5'-phosphate oxidase family protein [Geobacter sp.]